MKIETRQIEISKKKKKEDSKKTTVSVKEHIIFDIEKKTEDLSATVIDKMLRDYKKRGYSSDAMK